MCRHVSTVVAMRVMKMAFSMGHLHNPAAQKAMEASDSELRAYVVEHMYEPVYKPLISLPVGVLE